MIGAVNARLEALLPLSVFGPSGQQMVTAVIDTGFTEALALPPDIIGDLGPAFRRRGATTLADGSTHGADVYAARVLWEGALRTVEVWSGPEPLVGVALLAGHRLRADFAVSGRVRVRPLA